MNPLDFPSSSLIHETTLQSSGLPTLAVISPIIFSVASSFSDFDLDSMNLNLDELEELDELDELEDDVTTGAEVVVVVVVVELLEDDDEVSFSVPSSSFL